MRKVVLVGACRTPMGKMGGELQSLSAVDLGAVVIREALVRAGIEPEQVDEVLMGCVLTAAQGQNVARQAAIKAGIPVETPAETINNVCGSGLKTVNLAAAMIRSGEADIIVAGGMESMSQAAYAIPKGRFGYRMGNAQLVDTMVNDALWDAFNDYHMGVTAENIVQRYGITREEQDAFAAYSQQKCQIALGEGRFADEIVPVEVAQKKGSLLIERDEAPRAGVTTESLAKLKAAFVSNGTVTAGNSSGINDGAAAIVVMSEEKAIELGVRPMAEWICGASTGVAPDVMGLGPISAVRKVLQTTQWNKDDVELYELNEAFAAQSIAVCRELELNAERVNVNGGAIALGHPVGASGCRILVTLLHEMKRRKAQKGVASLCVGGGMGVACAVQSIE